MAILCDKNTKLLVQGMGRMGQFHANLSIEYGTQVVGGVAPRQGRAARSRASRSSTRAPRPWRPRAPTRR